MVIVTAIFGLIWTFFGTASYAIIAERTGSPLLIICVIPYFCLGAIFCTAAIKNYRGGWPFILGGSFIGLVVFFIYCQVKWYVDNSPKASWTGIVIFVFFAFIGFVFLKFGHKRHKDSSKTIEIFDGKKANYFLKESHLIYLLVISFILGLFLDVFQENVSYSSIYFAIQIFFYIPAYFWYFKDKSLCKYKSSWLMNSAVIIYPIIAVPVYLFKSRNKAQAQKAFAIFLVVYTVFSCGLKVGSLTLNFLATDLP